MAEHELSGPERRVLLVAATAAPSLHNSQPWRFVEHEHHIDLYADPRRQLPVADPDGRQLLISCGAALFNLRVAAGHLGLEPKVRLMPEPNDQTLLATIELSARRVAPALTELLYEAIPLRHTNRYPFEEEPVPSPAAAAVVDAARLEGGDLLVPQELAERKRLADLVRSANVEHDKRPTLIQEAVQWTAVDDGRADGVPGYALGPLADDARATVRDLRRGAPVPGRPREPFEHQPVLAVLVTRADDRRSRVRAGQALQRVLLTATLHGLSASFVNQPLEVPALRRAVLVPGTLQGYPQMLLRLGRGVPVPATPRRPLTDVTAARPPR